MCYFHIIGAEISNVGAQNHTKIWYFWTNSAEIALIGVEITLAKQTTKYIPNNNNNLLLAPFFSKKKKIQKFGNQ